MAKAKGIVKPDEAEIEDAAGGRPPSALSCSSTLGPSPLAGGRAGHGLEGIGRTGHEPEEEGGHDEGDERGPRHEGIAARRRKRHTMAAM